MALAELEIEQRRGFFYRAYSRGYARGYARGLVEGRTERVLTARFGKLPRKARARISKASVKTLNSWVSRVATARSLNEVFSTH